MSLRTDELISELSRDLAPVRVLPPLAWVGGGVLAVVAGLYALYVPLGIFYGVLMPETARAWDFIAIGGHLLLGLGGLALALGSCIPGRDALESRGLVGVLAGAALSAVAVAAAVTLVPIEAVGPDWLVGTALCAGTAVVLAAIPAVVIARFAARAAPHRLGRTLVFGAISMLCLGTLPGHLGCAMPGALHTTFGHMLVPLLGSVVIWALMRVSYGRRVSAV